MGKKNKKDKNFRFPHSGKRGYPNAPSEYDLKYLLPEDRDFLLSHLPDADSPDYDEENNEAKRKIIPTFRLRKSIESLNKKTSFYSIVLIILTIVLVIMTH